MKKTFLLVAWLICVSVTVFSQSRQVKGKITDEDGMPVAGASVVVLGTKTGTTSNREGDFTLNVSTTGPVTLSITSSGHKPIAVSPEGDELLTVKLEKDITALEDVVVVGYATVKRKDLTGSVSSISSKQLKDIPVSSAAEALQGKLAGVQVISSEGAPGAEIIIRVRGGGSITQDNSPLYIVDGVQVENALSVISPQDIASIDVLKDASTTAIYGARAANGVIIITTKGGRSGKTQISYNGSMGWRELARTMNVLSPYDFVVWQYERSRGSVADSTSFAQTYGSTWDTLSVYKNIPPVNWQEEVFGRKAKYQNHNVSLSGGNQATTFNLSVTANKEDGILIESGFDRKLVNFKLDHKVSEKLKIGITTRYLDQTIRGAGTTNSGTRATNRLRQ